MLIGDIPLRADDKERKQVTSFFLKMNLFVFLSGTCINYSVHVSASLQSVIHCVIINRVLWLLFHTFHFISIFEDVFSPRR